MHIVRMAHALAVGTAQQAYLGSGPPASIPCSWQWHCLLGLPACHVPLVKQDPKCPRHAEKENQTVPLPASQPGNQQSSKRWQLYCTSASKPRTQQPRAMLPEGISSSITPWQSSPGIPLKHRTTQTQTAPHRSALTLTWTWLATAWALVRMRRAPSGSMTNPVAVHLVWLHICHGCAKLGLRQREGEGRWAERANQYWSEQSRVADHWSLCRGLCMLVVLARRDGCGTWYPASIPGMPCVLHSLLLLKGNTHE
jgi:hypothetical protein